MEVHNTFIFLIFLAFIAFLIMYSMKTDTTFILVISPPPFLNMYCGAGLCPNHLCIPSTQEWPAGTRNSLCIETLLEFQTALPKSASHIVTWLVLYLCSCTAFRVEDVFPLRAFSPYLFFILVSMAAFIFNLHEDFFHLLWDLAPASLSCKITFSLITGLFPSVSKYAVPSPTLK